MAEPVGRPLKGPTPRGANAPSRDEQSHMNRVDRRIVGRLERMPLEQDLKGEVATYWAANPCETPAYFERVGGAPPVSAAPERSAAFFEAIEAQRYSTQRDIWGFAQFARWRGKRVLEIGVGTGTDFLQWARAGADAYGVDLTTEAIELTRSRLAVYGVDCRELRVADAENLPYPDNFFDLVYSWGVLHHTPDTVRAISEAVRVVRPGGRVKLMLYNRRSFVALKFWIKYALLRGRPLTSISGVLARHMESPGTKAYKSSEIVELLSHLPVENISIDAAAGPREFGPPLDSSLKRRMLFAVRYFLTVLLGLNSADFFMKIEFSKRG